MPNHEDIYISRVGSRTSVLLKSWLFDRADPPAAAAAEQFRMLHLAPGEWLATSDHIAGAALCQHLEWYAAKEGVAVVDLSQGLSVLRITGAASREVLTKGCGLDLDPRHF